MDNKKKKVLFVCTGNTCRSPMAMAIFNRKAEEKNLGWVAESAGSSTDDGLPASENAVILYPELVKHRSRKIHKESIDSADLVLCMTEGNTNQAREFGRNKVFVFKPYLNQTGGVADPYKGSLDIYRTCAEELEKLMVHLIEKISQQDFCI